MTAFDFPASPALNATYTANGVTFTWNGYAWIPQAPAIVFGFMSWPAGIGLDWWGAALPQGARWCDGAQYDPAIYAALYAAIGSTFNTGGETAGWFRVPDAKGRSSIGKDDMGGAAAGRVTTAGGHGIDGTILGSRGGAQSHTLASGQMPAHLHTYAWPAALSTAPTGINMNSGAATTQNTGTTGGSGAHPNVQPGIICNKLVTTGGVP